MDFDNLAYEIVWRAVPVVIDDHMIIDVNPRLTPFALHKGIGWKRTQGGHVYALKQRLTRTSQAFADIFVESRQKRSHCVVDLSEAMERMISKRSKDAPFNLQDSVLHLRLVLGFAHACRHYCHAVVCCQ